MSLTAVWPLLIAADYFLATWPLTNSVSESVSLRTTLTLLPMSASTLLTRWDAAGSCPVTTPTTLSLSVTVTLPTLPVGTPKRTARPLPSSSDTLVLLLTPTVLWVLGPRVRLLLLSLPTLSLPPPTVRPTLLSVTALPLSLFPTPALSTLLAPLLALLPATPPLLLPVLPPLPAALVLLVLPMLALPLLPLLLVAALIPVPCPHSAVSTMALPWLVPSASSLLSPVRALFCFNRAVTF